MFRRTSIVLFSVLYLSTTIVHAEDKKPAWAEKMQALKSVLEALLIDVSSDERFKAPENSKRISQNAEKLADLAHSLKASDLTAPDKDPSVAMIASLFEKEAQHAAQTLGWGHREYARSVLRSMTSYCIACHTRNSSGPEFSGLDTNSEISKLKPMERASYFAAIREFDKSLGVYEEILSTSKKNETYTFEFEKAARSALAISVRVKKDPAKALKIVDETIANKQAPQFLKEDAKQWKESIQDWKNELPRQVRTEEGFYSEAIRLMAKAKKIQKFPMDRSADVLYLRASAALHDLLSIAPKGKHATEALYLAGLSYDVLQDLGILDLHDFYYLSCIYQTPHSTLARQCFRQYEESIYLGYSGSGGTFLPKEERERLDMLDALSDPAKKASLQ